MRVVPVHAYGIAGTLRPKEVAALCGDPARLRITKTMAIAAHGGDDFTVIYDFGAVVFFGMTDAERSGALGRILATTGPEPHPPVVDDYLVEVREGAPPSTSFDRACVPELDGPRVEMIALVLAQSVAMDYYDEDVETMFARVSSLAQELAEHGRLRHDATSTMRLVGRILATRNQIATTLSLLDAPGLTWENEAHDRLYRAMRATFEVEDRYRTLQHKLGIIQDNLEIVVDLAQARRGFLLEAAVVIMIAIELVIGLVQIVRR